MLTDLEFRAWGSRLIIYKIAVKEFIKSILISLMSLHSDWLQMVRFIHESHYFCFKVHPFSQSMRMGQ